MLGIDLVT